MGYFIDHAFVFSARIHCPGSVVERLGPGKIMNCHGPGNIMDQLGPGGIVEKNSDGAWCRFIKHDAELCSLALVPD